MKRLRMYLTLTLALLCLGNGAWPPSGRAAAVDSPAPARPVGSVSLPLKGAPARTVQPGLSGAGSQTRQSQVAKLTANDGAAGDYFGWWVSVSGDTAFITAPYADVGANADQGAVYVYHNEGWPDVWNHVLKLTSGDGKAGDMFGYSVSLSGDTAVVGATLADVGHNVDQGAAYVLYRNQGGPDAWGQVAKLTASDGAAGDWFGTDVELRVDTAVVTAWYADVGGNVDQGAAYVFYRNQGGPDAWGQVAKLTASDGAAGDGLDLVSLSGDTIIAGALWADVDGNADQGAAYVFYRNQGGPDAWGQVTKLTAADGMAGDWFGGSVSLSGDTVLIGALLADVGGNIDQGAAYIFERNLGGPDAWGQVAKLTASDGAAGNAFGAYPSLSGDTAVIGAFFADVGGNVGQGAAYVFYRDLGGPGTWGQAAKLTSADGAAGDEFGGWVSFSGAVVMITACLADVGGNVDQGAAYVFALPSLHLFKLKASTRPAAKPGWNKVIVQGIVHDGDGNAFSGATAAGTWTLPDGSIVPGAALGPTDARGRFKFRLKEPQCGLFQFDVTGISATAYTYDPMSSEFSPHIEITVPCP